MDKYQRKIIDLSKVSIDNEEAKILFQENELIIEQSENAHIEKYNISIQNSAISRIVLDGKEIKKSKDLFMFLLDFSNKATSIKFEFVDGIAESMTLNIIYNEKSKKAWDDKEKQKIWDSLIPQAKIKFATGQDLVNIYFQPVSDDYGKTVIELYTAIGKWTPHPSVIGRGMKFVPGLISAEKDALIAKYTVEDGTYFKSINGLAYGAYGFRLSQYTSKGELLFTSDYYYFPIQDK